MKILIAGTGAMALEYAKVIGKGLCLPFSILGRNEEKITPFHSLPGFAGGMLFFAFGKSLRFHSRFKIDVEGYELEVLRGMETALRNSPNCCGLVEMHCHMRRVSPTAVESLLEGAVFNLQEITRDGVLPYHTDRNDGHAIWVEKRS